jgi:lipopolysaccharide export system protein LptA
MRFFCISLLFVSCTALLCAQPAGTPSFNRDELNQRFSEARSNLGGEKLRLNEEAEHQQNMEIRQQLAVTGSEPKISEQERNRDATANGSMIRALKNLSEEGKLRIAQSEPVAPRALPLEEVSAGSGPEPQPLTPAPLTPPEKKKAEHIIIAADSIIWDSSQSIMVAVGNVDLQHPDFHLTCEEMEVHMKKQDKKKPEAEKSTAAPAGEANLNTNSLEKVLARGPKVVVEKVGTDGKMKTGQCRYLIYDAATGIVTLRIWPQVSDGTNVQIADEESTVMTLSPKGVLTTRGRSHVDIISAENQKKSKPKSSAKATDTKSAP